MNETRGAGFITTGNVERRGRANQHHAVALARIEARRRKDKTEGITMPAMPKLAQRERKIK